MLRNFSGTHQFTHPETKETYFVEYKGYYRPAKLGSTDNSYPAEGSLVLKDIPADIQEYEDLIRQDIWDYETS